eukprot:jgi/Bigna1/137751/aug1.41_g12459
METGTFVNARVERHSAALAWLFGVKSPMKCSRRHPVLLDANTKNNMSRPAPMSYIKGAPGGWFFELGTS